MPRATAKRPRERSPRGARPPVEEPQLEPTRPRSQRRAALAAIERQESTSGDDLPSNKPESDGEEAEGQEKKTRFVWTPDLHRRFETAVHRLGVAQAKPQAIRQLMGCDTEDEPPTRQNIKSHLQKYRLLVQKQQAQKQQSHLPLRMGADAVDSPSPAHSSASSASAGGGGGAAGGGGPAGRGTKMGEVAPTLAANCERFRQQQQVGLLAQLEIQTKLHEQMVEQRKTQVALSLRLSQAGREPALRQPQLQRLAQHVLMQRMMLQHLCSMLHATTVDLANDTLAHDTLAMSTASPGDPPASDVFDCVGVDGEGTLPAFPFDLPPDAADALDAPEPPGVPEPSAQRLHSSLDNIEVEATPLQSDVVVSEPAVEAKVEAA